MIKYSGRLIPVVALVSMVFAFMQFLSVQVYAEDINPVVGKSGDYVLREADFDRLLSNQTPETRKLIDGSPEQRANFIRQILLTKAVSSKAKKDNYDKKPEVKELLSNLIDQFLSQEYLNKVVIANVTVSDEEIKKYYSEHLKEFQIPEALKVRHIFVSAPKEAAVELREKAKIKAEGILQLITKGEDFAKIALEQSEDTDSASKGGELGYITAGKTNSIEFEKAVFALKTGEVSKVIETPFGYHIIRADDRKDARTATLDEAREYITNQLKEENSKQKVQDFLDKLTKETGLEIMGQTTDKPVTVK